MKLDPAHMQVLFSLLSAYMQMGATILMLCCVVNFFSLKPGSSVKGPFVALLYFFSSAIFAYGSSVWLSDVSMRADLNMKAGIISLAQAQLIHISYGLLIFALYLRTLMSKIKR